MKIAERVSAFQRNLEINVPRGADGHYRCKHCAWDCDTQGDVEERLPEHTGRGCDWAQRLNHEWVQLGLLRRDPQDPLVSWETNETWPADPPDDRADWVRIIRQVAPLARVVLTTDDRGNWRVAVAEEAPIHVGSPPPNPMPIDHRVAVTKALRDAGKRVRD